VPGSIEVRRNLYEAGLLDVYQRAGFRSGEVGCSMCLGIASDRAQPGEVWLSSQNRNFPNRMGKGSLAWLASAATVAASAFDMTITDPRALLEKVDQSTWEKLTSARDLPPVTLNTPSAPAANGSTIKHARNGQHVADRIVGHAQLFGDHVDTDAIIPGEFCHLSDLKEIGAKAFYHVRPDFVERVQRGEDIIVAGEGWGSGSSREHAAWALKGADVKAVIAKSFAYIHKRNLVNEAIPFIILRDEDFYAKVSDGSVVEVDLEHGAVTLNGAIYHGEALPRVMTEIMEHGGLVSHVKLELE
jgi:aconitate hydratase/homoaconitate hydratase